MSSETTNPKYETERKKVINAPKKKFLKKRPRRDGSTK